MQPPLNSQSARPAFTTPCLQVSDGNNLAKCSPGAWLLAWLEWGSYYTLSELSIPRQRSQGERVSMWVPRGTFHQKSTRGFQTLFLMLAGLTQRRNKNTDYWFRRGWWGCWEWVCTSTSSLFCLHSLEWILRTLQYSSACKFSPW